MLRLLVVVLFAFAKPIFAAPSYEFMLADTVSNGALISGKCIYTQIATPTRVGVSVFPNEFGALEGEWVGQGAEVGFKIVVYVVPNESTALSFRVLDKFGKSIASNTMRFSSIEEFNFKEFTLAAPIGLGICPRTAFFKVSQ